MPSSLNGTGITFNDGTIQNTAASGSTYARLRTITSGTTYTKPTEVIRMYVFVYGASGGANTAGGRGGTGGPGYSEKYYSSPAASYSYALGAAGSTAGTAGGTTTWGGVITVTGSGGVTNATGGAGGVGSGGDFNATGGLGGNGNGVTWQGNASAGGSGGAASRAGVGGNGGSNVGQYNGGGGGGTGGNNGSGTNGGAAATAKAAGALTFPFTVTETFAAGLGGSINDPGNVGGGPGANAQDTFNMEIFGMPPLGVNSPRATNGIGPTAFTGQAAQIQILEICTL